MSQGWPAPEYIELGCGRNKAEGYFGVDRINVPGVDLVHDLDRHPWPIADGCARAVLCHQTAEHIHDLIGFMRQLWRVCRPNAWVEIVVPYYKARGAWGDPTHVRHFTEDTFAYFEPGFVERFSDYGVAPCYFHIVDEGWKEAGNLWVLLQPLKTDQAVAIHEEEKRWRDRKWELLG